MAKNKPRKKTIRLRSGYSMDSRGAAPRPFTVQEMANLLLADRGEATPTTVGKNWLSTIINRRPELCTP